MATIEDIDWIKQFRELLRPFGIEIWSSSESLPEEVMQQLMTSEEDVPTEQPRAEELHLQQRIDVLPKGTAPIQIANFLDGSPRTVNVGYLLGSNGISYPVALAHVGASSVTFERGRWRDTGLVEKYLILAALKKGMGINIDLKGKWKLEDPTDQLGAGRQIDVTDAVEMRGAAVRRARRRMRNCEKELVCKLSREYPTEWTAVDGTLFEVEGYSELKNTNVVGIRANSILIYGRNELH